MIRASPMAWLWLGAAGCVVAPGRPALVSGIVRPVQCGSQATAQNHQDPQGLHVLRALALLPHEALNPLRQQYLERTGRFDYRARS